WLRLISTGTITPDSFEYAVVRHWLEALDLEAEAAAAKGAAADRTLSLVAASLSLVALIVPPLAPLALAADLLLLSFTIYSAAGQSTADRRASGGAAGERTQAVRSVALDGWACRTARRATGPLPAHRRASRGRTGRPRTKRDAIRPGIAATARRPDARVHGQF